MAWITASSDEAGIGVADIPNSFGTEHPGLKCSFSGNHDCNTRGGNADRMSADVLEGRIALVTGANHAASWA
jgi:hypothetical protein